MGYNQTIINKRKNAIYSQITKLKCYFIQKYNNSDKLKLPGKKKIEDKKS